MGDLGVFESALASIFSGVLNGKDAQDSVLDRFDPTGALPAAPTVGDRYIATATANGWTNKYIYECTQAGVWTGQLEIVPNEGFWCTVEDENAIYYYNNSGVWVKIGTVLDHTNLQNIGTRSHATIDTDIDALEAQNADTNEATGFLNITDSEIAFDDDGSVFSGDPRRLRIQPAVTTFDYYIEGTKYTKNAAEYIQIPDTEGIHYIYYDDGTLSTTMTWNDNLLLIYAIVAIVYWDATNNEHTILADERHGITMDGKTHLYLHDVRGTQWCTGLALGNMTVDGDGSSNTHARFSVSDGEICDEDLKISIVDGSPQDLSTIAQVPVYYKSGASGDWRKDTATDYAVKNFSGGSGRLAWNEYTGGAWQQTEVTNNQFVLAHIFATNDTVNPIIAIQGQNDYNNIVSAREGASTEINTLITAGLPVEEFTPIASIIFQTGAYANTPKARVRSTDTGDNYVDWRGASISQSSAVNSHSNLSELDYNNSGHSGFGRAAHESASDPVANNDTVDTATLGKTFKVGDTWYNTTDETYWFCKDSTATAAVWVELLTFEIPYVIDGNMGVLTNGDKHETTIPFKCDIKGWRVKADASDTFAVDIEYNSDPSGTPATITGAGTKPNVSGSDYGTGTNFTNWTIVTFVKGGTWRGSISGGPAAATKVTLTLIVLRI